MDIEIREARSLVTLAESLSFTKAARSLGVSQSALSQSIARLEKKVGFELVRRSSRLVLMTPAGETLLVEMRRLLDSEAHVKEAAQSMATRESANLRPVRIGAAITLLLGFLPQVLESMTGILPLIRQMGGTAQELAFERGELDIGLQRVWDDTRPGLIAIGVEPLYLACNIRHPLARETSVSLSQLTDDRLLMFHREAAPQAYDAIMKAVSRGGLRRPMMRLYEDEAEFLGLVSCGVGLGVVPQSLMQIGGVGIAFVRVADSAAVTPITIRYDQMDATATEIAHRLAESARAVLSARRG